MPTLKYLLTLVPNLGTSFIAKIETGQRHLDIIEYIWYFKKLGVDRFEGLEVVLNYKSLL
jgi:hypothetical protein